jgi:hypothetical protein
MRTLNIELNIHAAIQAFIITSNAIKSSPAGTIPGVNSETLASYIARAEKLRKDFLEWSHLCTQG